MHKIAQNQDFLREASELKNVTKSGKSPKGGEGSAQNIEKSKIRNLDFLLRGGEAIFPFPPKCKCKPYMIQLNKQAQIGAY